jgi:hypothetical protein
MVVDGGGSGDICCFGGEVCCEGVGDILVGVYRRC